MRSLRSRRPAMICLAAVAAAVAGASTSLLGVCGPFTDTANDAFCPFVLEIFYLGITTGTTPTTFSPADDVTRLQMAAFLSRTVDGLGVRTGRRAALQQFWTPKSTVRLPTTVVGNEPHLVAADGADLWVANKLTATVSRVRGSDGKLLENWTGATSAIGVLAAAGKVFVTGRTSPGNLYRIDPDLAAGPVTTVASTLGNLPVGITFDGVRIWTANTGGPSVSIVTPPTWTVTSVSGGFSQPLGALYDGANVWITDIGAGTLLKLDANGAILQTVTVGANPVVPVYDGTSIWVPNSNSNSVSVVRASNGAVLATLTGNGLDAPEFTAFDGQRVLVCSGSGDTVSLWKATDLTSLGSYGTGVDTYPNGACSDGVNFWITYGTADRLARF